MSVAGSARRVRLCVEGLVGRAFGLGDADEMSVWGERLCRMVSDDAEAWDYGARLSRDRQRPRRRCTQGGGGLERPFSGDATEGLGRVEAVEFGTLPFAGLRSSQARDGSKCDCGEHR